MTGKLSPVRRFVFIIGTVRLTEDEVLNVSRKTPVQIQPFLSPLPFFYVSEDLVDSKTKDLS